MHNISCRAIDNHHGILVHVSKARIKERPGGAWHGAARRERGKDQGFQQLIKIVEE